MTFQLSSLLGTSDTALSDQATMTILTKHRDGSDEATPSKGRAIEKSLQKAILSKKAHSCDTLYCCLTPRVSFPLVIRGSLPD